MRRPRVPFALAGLLLLTACGSGDPVTASTSAPTTVVDANPTTDTAPSTDTTVGTTTSTVVEETTSTTTTTTTSVPTVPADGLAVVDETDRAVAVTSVIVAESDGNLLATMFDPDSVGCEGVGASYFATIGVDGSVVARSVDDEPFQYAGEVSASPNRRQLLEVTSCEGFLGSVTVYDLDPSLVPTNPVRIDTLQAISGDATWNPDGFITMVLSDQHGFYADVDAPEANIDEYLVNPRTGESTQSGTVEELRYGAVRTPDGSHIYAEWGADPAVVFEPRGAAEERRFAASGFALSPDTSQLVLWDSVWTDADDPRIELLDMDTGAITTIGTGPTLRAVWRDDSTRLAYSAGNETFVHDLITDATVSAGTAEPVDCREQDFVRWGRVPLAFAPDGDLYVGDPECVSSTDGFPTVQYRLRQLSLR